MQLSHLNIIVAFVFGDHSPRFHSFCDIKGDELVVWFIVVVKLLGCLFNIYAIDFELVVFCDSMADISVQNSAENFCVWGCDVKIT